MRAALISVLLVSSVAHAHGGSGDHDSPQWCGEHLAMVGDGGVIVDGKLAKVPVTVALIAWSPTCDRIVVAPPSVTADERVVKPITNTAYKDAMFSIAPLALGLVTAGDALVLVDRATGTERQLAPKVDYLQAMSADGSHALALVGSKPASIDATGAVSTFAGDLVYGRVADETTGWNAAGTLTVVLANKAWVISAIGEKVRPWNGLPKGTVDHISVHPDGKRAAFVLEVEEPLGKRDRHCDYEGRSRADLYVGDLGTRANPRKIATVAHLHSCGIE